MRSPTILSLMLPVLILPALAQEAKMDPRVAYAPDVLGVDRLFMVAIKAPPDAPKIDVQVPPQVKLLDQTPLPTKADVRRYYFRTQQPGKDIKIVFAHPDGPLTVSVEIWSLADLQAFRKLKDVQLPRRWPLGETLPELKDAQTLTTQAQKEAARKGGGGAEAWLNTPDDDIWNMQPDTTIPRWHWVNVQFGCPVHGTEIYQKQAYYPWIKDSSFPYKWKIECPVGHELYPSNDIGKDDFTSGPFPDDGVGGGFVGPNGQHYGFLAELCQLYCHRMLQVAPPCAQSYLATGDVRYVHKALVALSRLAVEYAYLATMTQHRHRNSQSQVDRFGQGRFDEGPILGATGLTVYSIDQPGYQVSHAEAYDKIFDAIDKDPEIVPYLQNKGIDVKTGEDVRRFIEENLMATWMQGAMDGATQSNEPFSQWGLAKMAEMLNYRRGNEFFDWLYDRGGKMRIFVPNDYFRDGAPFESTGGYNGMHVTALGPIIDSIEHLKALRPEVYPDDKYPSLSKSRRYRNVFDFCMDTVLIDRTFPLIGDSGSPPKYSKLPETTYHDANDQAFEHAYRLFKDPKFAWALTHHRTWKPSLDFPYTREQMEQAAAKWPEDWNDRSSLHDGYGIAILRDGKGDDKRALWMMYGRARSHVQDNIMDIGLTSNQGVILQHMGYPRNWGYWEYSWSSHNLVRQFPFLELTARPQFLADAGVAQVCEARAKATNDYDENGVKQPEPDNYWQRRMLAMVSVSPDQYYCVDLYRICGGKDHWWAFHCQEGDFETQGLTLTKQQGGTLAGPDVPYGDVNWLKEHGCSESSTYGWRGLNFVFPHLYNVEKGNSDGGWSANWKLKTGEGLQFRLNMVTAPGTEVNITDGTSPAGGKPYEMKWLMLHRQAEEPATSQFLSLMETYLNTPAVQSVEKLEVSGTDEGGLAPAGCVVKLADRTDYIMASADASVTRTAGADLKFAGRFGLYAEQNGQPVAISLVGGTEISKGKFGLKIDQPEFRGKIVKVDRKREVITVSPAPPVEGIVGQYIFLTTGERRLGYKVVAAKAVAEGAELSLNMDSRIGTGQVTGTADLKVLTETPFTLHYYDYYEGARIVNAKGDAEYRLNEVRSKNAAMIDRTAHPEATAAKLAEQFPKGSWFEVYDYGVGDEVVWPYTVSVRRTGPGIYQVKSPVPVVVNLPK